MGQAQCAEGVPLQPSPAAQSEAASHHSCPQVGCKPSCIVCGTATAAWRYRQATEVAGHTPEVPAWAAALACHPHCLATLHAQAAWSVSGMQVMHCPGCCWLLRMLWSAGPLTVQAASTATYSTRQTRCCTQTPPRSSNSDCPTSTGIERTRRGSSNSSSSSSSLAGASRR